MKDLFKLKFLLHRFINYLFYFLFFIVGFLVGGGSFEKISDIFNNFFS